MAIYHLHAQIVSRANGDSVVAGAAYRSGQNLYDEQVGQHFDYTRKSGVAHAEILAPVGAAEWVFDRQQLWNRVEAGEKRKDAQLAREFDIALPVELSKAEQIATIREYAKRAFVSRGMVADFALHLDNPENPHAHFLVTMRDLTADGFGPKRRDWNAKEVLFSWRDLWAECANEHLLRAGLDIRIDERTLEVQGLDLVPGRKLGLSQERQALPDLPDNLAERVAEQRAIAAENGRRIIEKPTLVLTALTHYQATFTERDVAKFLNTKTDGAEQFEEARLKVLAAPELLALGRDDRGLTRFTSKDMLAIERGMLERVERMSKLRTHVVAERYRTQALKESRLSAEQTQAFEHVTAGGDVAVLVGVAGTGKSTMLEGAMALALTAIAVAEDPSMLEPSAAASQPS